MATRELTVNPTRVLRRASVGVRTRQVGLNFLTILLTIGILSLIAFVASSHAAGINPGDFEENSGVCPTGKMYEGPKTAPLAVGFVSDPYQIRTYQAALGAQYPLAFYGSFQAWSRNENPLSDFLAASGNRVLPYITWEPWSPPSNATSDAEQALPQDEWTNAVIASGAHDAYITEWANAVKAYGKPVYIRYAHEMNSTTYPWGFEPSEYVAAWRHIYNIFHAVGAKNAQFVFSVNANTYQTPTQWCGGWDSYWPGAKYVNEVGITTVQFGGARVANYTIANFAKRIQILRHLGKPINLAEANVVYEDRIPWFKELATYLHKAPWVESLIISQTPSRANTIDGVAGNLSWDIRQDPATLQIVRGIMKDRPIFGRKAAPPHKKKGRK